MKRNLITFLVLTVIGSLVIIASIELHAKDLDTNLSSEKEAVVILELFTSQGCSSCPPADELLKRVQQEREANVITLSYHVDYWNYIGWADPFSDPLHTNRQRDYNQKFGSPSNYTPQLVINGKEHMVGSNSSKLYSKISDYSRQSTENTIAISDIRKEDKSVHIGYKVDGPLKGKQIRAALLIDQRVTLVQRGENRNRKLRNSNIVVAMVDVAIKSKEGSMEVPIPGTVIPEDQLRVVLLVENQDMDISGGVRSKVF